MVTGGWKMYEFICDEKNAKRKVLNYILHCELNCLYVCGVGPSKVAMLSSYSCCRMVFVIRRYD